MGSFTCHRLVLLASTLLILLLLTWTPAVESAMRGQAMRLDQDQQRRIRSVRERTLTSDVERNSSESEEDKSSKYKYGKETKGNMKKRTKKTKTTKNKGKKGSKTGKISKASKYKQGKQSKAKKSSEDNSNVEETSDSDSSELASGSSQVAPSSMPSHSIEPSSVPTSSNEPTRAPRPTTSTDSDSDEQPSADPTDDDGDGDNDATDSDDDAKEGDDDENEGDGDDSKPSDASPTKERPDAPQPTPTAGSTGATDGDDDNDATDGDDDAKEGDDDEEEGDGDASKPSDASPTKESPDAPRPTPTAETNNGPTSESPETNFTGTIEGETLSLPPIYNEDFTQTTPSSAPALGSGRACEIASNLSFGTITGGGRQVEFFYQMETDSSVTQDTVNEVLLPLLEGALAERLLALLFSECREESTMLRGGDMAAVCEAQGYSGFPIDQVLDGVSCIGVVDPSNSCFVVDAGANLYFESDADCPGAISKSRSEIKSAMESGSFNNLEARIVNITYLEASDLDFSSPNTIESSSTGSDKATLPVYAWALIALGVVSLIVGGVIVFSRHRRHSREEEAPNFVPVYRIDIACEPSMTSDNTWYDRQGQNEGVPSQGDAMLLPKMEQQENDKEADPPKEESHEEDKTLPPKTELGETEKNDLPTAVDPDDVEVHDIDEVPVFEVSFEKKDDAGPPPELEDISGDESSDTASMDLITDTASLEQDNDAEGSRQGNDAEGSRQGDDVEGCRQNNDVEGSRQNNDAEGSRQGTESEVGERNVQEDVTGDGNMNRGETGSL